jgi:hypothetical protein
MTETDDERTDGSPSESDLDVPETAPMSTMPPEVAAAIGRELAKAVVEKKRDTEQIQVIDIERLPIDLMGGIPQFDRWYWYKGWKKDPTDSSKIVYDLYVSPMKISKILAKSLENIETRWGVERAKAYSLWTVTRARTYDPINKRVVPIRQIVMTPLMARRGAAVAKLLDILTPDIIKRSVEYISKHENLIWADMAKQKAQEAETAWTIVDGKASDHFESTERMLKYAGEATDKGDEEFAKSFTENKDWKDKLADNWCLVILAIFVSIYVLGYAAGWWVG